MRLTPVQIKEIFTVIQANCDTQCNILRTKHAVTIIASYPYRHVQIILRLYQNPQEVIMGFDIDCCAVLYDGTDVWMLPRARRAINKQYNLFDKGAWADMAGADQLQTVVA